MALPFVTVVACGGVGRRIGGDKPARLLAGVSLIERAVGIARGYGAPVALAMRGDAPIDVDDIPHLFDAAPDLGPIAALSSGFAFAASQQCPFVLVIGCDQPFLPSDLPVRLAAAIGECGVALPVSGGRDQTMAALWHVNPQAIEDYIAGGGRSLWRYAERVGVARLPWEAAGGDPFADVDDHAQLQAAEARLRSADLR